MIVASYGKVYILDDCTVGFKGETDEYIGDVVREGTKYYVDLHWHDGLSPELLMDISLALMRFEIWMSRRN